MMRASLRLCGCVAAVLLGCSTAPAFPDSGPIDVGTTSFDIAPPRDFGMRDFGPPPETLDLTDVSLFRDVMQSDVPCVPALPAEYRFGRTGGNGIYEDTFTLRPPSTFVALRTFRDASPVRCETMIPPCGNPAEVDLGEVAAALDNPDVQMALARGGDVFYGVDTRPADGTAFYLQRGTARVLMGEPCRTGGGASCVNPPVGVQRLIDVLNGLREQELLRMNCAALGTRTTPDAGPRVDTPSADAGVLDASVTDAGAMDASVTDADR